MQETDKNTCQCTKCTTSRPYSEKKKKFSYYVFAAHFAEQEMKEKHRKTVTDIHICYNP